MTNVGFATPQHILPFDHRGSFQTKPFGWVQIFEGKSRAA
jgi:hypothetical protein